MREMSFTDIIDQQVNRVSHILKIFSIIFLSISVSITFINVVLRYVFKSPIFWADELATLSLIAMVFLPLAFVEKTSGHLQVTALLLILGKNQKLFCEYLRVIASIFVGMYVVLYGFPLVYQNYLMSIKTIALKVPTALTFSVIPIAFLAVTIVNILVLIKLLCKKNVD